jgi:hypothetical protein
VTTQEQIDAYIAGQPEPKRADLLALHRLMLDIAPDCALWFLDGRNEDGKVVANPNIGYGFQTIQYAGRKTRDFYRIGISANTTGISIYLIGLEDKAVLGRTFGDRLGKAGITGYCTKFRSLKDLDMKVLAELIRLGFEAARG